MMEKIIENYLLDAQATFRNYQKMAETAMAQVSDDEFFCALDAEANSIAIIVKHIAGNLRSRWKDFLTSDGEKPDRQRDTEFILVDETRRSLMRMWENSWQTLFYSINLLTAKDFRNVVTIRGEDHSIVEAINRQMTHCAYHIGQIVFLAKHFRSDNWNTLSVPRGKSVEFNEFLAAKNAGGLEKSHPLDAPMEFSREKIK